MLQHRAGRRQLADGCSIAAGAALPLCLRRALSAASSALFDGATLAVMAGRKKRRKRHTRTRPERHAGRSETAAREQSTRVLGDATRTARHHSSTAPSQRPPRPSACRSAVRSIGSAWQASWRHAGSPALVQCRRRACCDELTTRTLVSTSRAALGPCTAGAVRAQARTSRVPIRPAQRPRVNDRAGTRGALSLRIGRRLAMTTPRTPSCCREGVPAVRKFGQAPCGGDEMGRRQEHMQTSACMAGRSWPAP